MNGTTSGRAPTMKDVAREAGVALGTVSKVFNRFDTVGEDYRRKVMDAADRLGYQVNSYARGLKTNKTYSVAVILPNIIVPFFGVLAQGLCTALTARNYRMFLSVTDFDPDAEERYIRMAQQNQVDGIIGLTYNPRLNLAGNVPFVSFDRYVSSDVPCVSSDNFGGGHIAAQKLTELGCRRLLFLRIGSAVAGESDKRRDGFESFCRAQELEYDTLYLYDGDGLEPFRDYLGAHMKDGQLYYDGIFCCTDTLAMEIKKILEGLSLRVPEDVQIIGFDGTGAHTGQGLVCSTVIQPIPLLAEKCVDILLKEDKSDLPSLICLPVTYAPGGTTRDDV
ncbi:MAG: LacI family transcriptional regulator [Butyricicoccus sp.]|nr:LacI family transcriptional regulator [Butyricicoccus sp.]